jgi:hypothetical protein
MIGGQAEINNDDQHWTMDARIPAPPPSNLVSLASSFHRPRQCLSNTTRPVLLPCALGGAPDRDLSIRITDLQALMVV